MPPWDGYGNRSAMPVPHGPGCGCDVCAGQRIQNTERLSSTDRLAWLESMFIKLDGKVKDIEKGNNAMGYALWCKTGGHSFDELDEGAERLTVEKRDEKGKKTGEEVTYHVCSRHVGQMFTPKPKSLAEIQQDIAEATVIE